VEENKYITLQKMSSSMRIDLVHSLLLEKY